jgi:hypothetical protein
VADGAIDDAAATVVSRPCQGVILIGSFDMGVRTFGRQLCLGSINAEEYVKAVSRIGTAYPKELADMLEAFAAEGSGERMVW